MPKRSIVHAVVVSKRPRFFAGKLLTAADFEAEQDYVVKQLHLLARAALGVGIVDGLRVSATPAGVQVSPGLAVNACGRLIQVVEPCVLALPARPGVWDVTVALVDEPCDRQPTLGADDDGPHMEPTMICETVIVALTACDGTSTPGREPPAVHLARVRRSGKSVRVMPARRRAKPAR